MKALGSSGSSIRINPSDGAWLLGLLSRVRSPEGRRGDYPALRLRAGRAVAAKAWSSARALPPHAMIEDDIETKLSFAELLLYRRVGSRVAHSKSYRSGGREATGKRRRPRPLPNVLAVHDVLPMVLEAWRRAVAAAAVRGASPSKAIRKVALQDCLQRALLVNYSGLLISAESGGIVSLCCLLTPFLTAQGCRELRTIQPTFGTT